MESAENATRWDWIFSCLVPLGRNLPDYQSSLHFQSLTQLTSSTWGLITQVPCKDGLMSGAASVTLPDTKLVGSTSDD